MTDDEQEAAARLHAIVTQTRKGPAITSVVITLADAGLLSCALGRLAKAEDGVVEIEHAVAVLDGLDRNADTAEFRRRLTEETR